MSFCARPPAEDSLAGFGFDSALPITATEATASTNRLFFVRLGDSAPTANAVQVTPATGTYTGPRTWHSNINVVRSEFEARISISSFSGPALTAFTGSTDPDSITFAASDIPLTRGFTSMRDTFTGFNRTGFTILGFASSAAQTHIVTGTWTIRHKASGVEKSVSFTLRYN